MDPSYNPWATPMFPQGAAFGTGSPAEDAQRAPNLLDNLLSHIAGALGRGFMAPGQALQSTEPITTEQMIKPASDMAGMMTLGAGAIPSEANTLRAGMLRVARKGPDGLIKAGKPGDIHSDLMTRQELSASFDSPEVAASMGYATPDGQFLTRDEALQFALRNEPKRAAWSAQQPQYGLDAATYHNEPR